MDSLSKPTTTNKIFRDTMTDQCLFKELIGDKRLILDDEVDPDTDPESDIKKKRKRDPDDPIDKEDDNAEDKEDGLDEDGDEDDDPDETETDSTTYLTSKNSPLPIWILSPDFTS